MARLTFHKAESKKEGKEGGPGVSVGLRAAQFKQNLSGFAEQSFFL